MARQPGANGDCTGGLTPCVSALCVFALWTAAPWSSLKAEPVPPALFTRKEALVDGAGRPLLLRGTNLGNWLEPEGYMFHFGDNGPTSPREIEDYFDELIGPQQAKTFWHQYRDVYITKADIDLLQSTGTNSVRVPIHYKFFTPGNDEGLDLLDRVVSWAKADGCTSSWICTWRLAARPAPTSTTVMDIRGSTTHLPTRRSWYRDMETHRRSLP